MLGLVLRRLRAQRRLVAAVVVLVAIATTQAGVATLLLGPTQDRGFSVAVQRSQPPDTEVTAFLVDLPGAELTSVREQAAELVRDVVGPMDPTVSSIASSQMRTLGDGDGSDGAGYLGTADALDQRAELTSGRWPRPRTGPGPAEAVLPESAARQLDVAPGDRMRLEGETGLGGVDNAVRLVVVGTFRPRAGSGWEGDRLGGAGYDPAYNDGASDAPAYGPFLVDETAFLASGSGVWGLRVTARPDLGLADEASLRAAATALRSASARLSAQVGDRVGITRVGSDLPVTTSRLRAERSAARATVLVVLLLGTAMSFASLLLAGRLVAGVRDDERALLVALGLARGQQLRTALVEGLLVSLVAAVLAVPASAVAYAWLSRLPAVQDAGLARGVEIGPLLVASAAAVAGVMTLALVLPALDRAPSPAAGRSRRVVRSGADLLLLVVVGAAAWQLRTRPGTAASGADVVLTVAPVVFVLGLVLFAVRTLPVLTASAARVALRARTLVGPLAAAQAARRPQSVAAMVLLATAAAAATFGTSLHATWERSQRDQADLRVGTDLALVLRTPAGAAEAAAVVEATSRPGSPAAVSAVAVRPVALGSYLGERGSPPVLVAVDSAEAGALLRGRLDGSQTWAEVAAALGGGSPVDGVGLPAGLSGIELTGTATQGTAISVRPTAVVQDAAGFRSAVRAEAVPVDGEPHPLSWESAPGPGRLVALRLEVHQAPTAGPDAEVTAEVAFRLRVPSGSPGSDASGWQLRPLDQQSPVHAATVSVGRAGDDVVVEARMGLDLAFLAYTGADLLATAFEAPDVVPVAVSQQLADAVGAEVGGSISVTVGPAVVPLRVTAVLPTIPSAPGRAAVLADLDTLSRALVHDGRLEPLVDGWWVARPEPATEDTLHDLDLGEVTTRQEMAEELARGPLRVTVPVALLVLVVTAGVLLVAGAGLVVSGDRSRRIAEVARLRALGLTRGEVRRLLLAEHTALLVPLVVLGALAGAVTAVAIGPALVRSDLGVAPVPPPVVVWPWAAELALTGGLLVACSVVVWAVTAGQVRRSDPALLRTDGS